MIGEIKTIEKPKHIIFDGALYELIDSNVPTVYQNSISFGVETIPCMEPFRVTCDTEEQK